MSRRRERLGEEIDLLVHYPRARRNVEERGATKTEEDRLLARKFGKEFFDGDRRHGYGGFSYQARFWQPVIPTFQEHYGLTARSSVLDIGCAKGFMLHDMLLLIPGITVKGIDVSEYAIANAIEDVRPHVQVASAVTLPFSADSFDLVVSINTVHNLEREACGRALQEIMRVSRHHAFITVDAYRTLDERERMYAWNLTAKTIMSVEEWKEFFVDVGYTGDYYWFIP
jgi:SAM-dependent methyltransferase